MARGGMGMMSRERLWLGCRKRRDRWGTRSLFGLSSVDCPYMLLFTV